MWQYSKLTKVQKHVIDLMRDGWELGQSISSMDTGCWLQKGGCGHSGETFDVKSSTVHSLYKKGIIYTSKQVFPLRTYSIDSKDELKL